MKEHHYRITLEHLATATEGQEQHAPLQFEVGNHDDIFNIIERQRAKGHFDADTSAALGLGLKLFTEVMLKQRKHPLFADINQPMRDFIGKLKTLAPLETAVAPEADAASTPAPAARP
jgi:hypothetical protein